MRTLIGRREHRPGPVSIDPICGPDAGPRHQIGFVGIDEWAAVEFGRASASSPPK